jgi:hypothetical protein
VLLPKVLERLIVVALHRQSSRKTTKLREFKTNDSGTFSIRNYRPKSTCLLKETLSQLRDAHLEEKSHAKLKPNPHFPL